MESMRQIRERIEKARRLLAAGGRTSAKAEAAGALSLLGMHPRDARKLSAELAIERADARCEKQERKLHLGDHYDDICGPYCPAINTNEEWTAAWRRALSSKR